MTRHTDKPAHGAARQPAPEPDEMEIQRAAYHLWLEEGCPAGHELDHWLAARELLRHRPGRTLGRVPPQAPPALHFPRQDILNRTAGKTGGSNRNN